MNKSEDKLIVSVVVVTYNSSKYVLDTLESIKNQTYPYLSLIITDDRSIDKTVEICKEWVDKNKDRFVETIILESPVNTGVSANGNRGDSACKTKWVKGIAGDDILLPNCIQDNVDYVKNNPNCTVLFSKMVCFGKHENYTRKVSSYYVYDYFNKSPEWQYDFLLRGTSFIPSPTMFYNVEKLRTLNVKNDERIPYCEDLPKYLVLLRKGIKFHYMDKETIKYRVRKGALSNSSFKTDRLFFYYYVMPELVEKIGAQKAIEQDVDYQVRIFEHSLEYNRGLRIFFKKFALLYDNLKHRILGK